MNKRTSSSKLFFYDLYGGGLKVQVMADARYHLLRSISSFGPFLLLLTIFVSSAKFNH